MQKDVNIVHYWAGSPILPNSKWLRTLKVAERSAKAGWNNWLVLSKKPDDESLIQPFMDAGCKIIYQPRSKGNFDFGSAYRTFKLLRKIKCTLFHCNNDHTSPIIGAKLAGVPINIWSKLAMSSYYEEGVSPSGLRRLMPSLRITTTIATKVLTISYAVKKELVEQVGFADKMVVVDAPVPVENYANGSSKGIREEFNIDPEDIILTAVGHSVEVKGWDVALRAFSLIAHSTQNVKLLLVGKHTSSSFHEKLLKIIKDNNLEKKVTFVGSRRDIANILKASDIFIFPSRSEGVGAAIIESRAAGLPSIATNTGGIPEVVKDGVNGFLFARDNYEQLAEKMLQLITEPELRARFAYSASQGLEKYTIETYVENVFMIYQNLLEDQQRLI